MKRGIRRPQHLCVADKLVASHFDEPRLSSFDNVLKRLAPRWSGLLAQISADLVDVMDDANHSTPFANVSFK